jgi:hypothetical protein
MLVPTRGLPMRIDAADGQFRSSRVGGNIHELVELIESPTDAPFAAAASVVPRRPK